MFNVEEAIVLPNADEEIFAVDVPDYIIESQELDFEPVDFSEYDNIDSATDQFIGSELPIEE